MASRAVQLVLLIATISVWSVDATRARAEDDPAALAAALKDTLHSGGCLPCSTPAAAMSSVTTSFMRNSIGTRSSR
jgi:hypothetical protein